MTAEIIDAHKHFWDLRRFDYAWMPAGDNPLRRDHLPADIAPEAAAAGIAGVVAVQAHQSVAEARWLLELADADPLVAGVVGWVDLTDERLGETLAELTAHPKFKGVRHVVQDEPELDWILRPDVLRGIDLLADFGLSYDILIFPKHLPLIPALLERCPRTPFVVDHLAKPPIAAGELEPWRAGLRRVAEFRNVCCKLSGLVTEADHANWTPGDLRPYIDAAVEMFGPRRLMFGSDHPVCLLAASYETVVATCLDALAGLGADEVGEIMSGTARRFYRLGR